MKPNVGPLIVISILAITMGAAAERAQVPGFAEITNPVEGQSLSGVVTIEGTASHPSFQSYSVSFAYDPNPTGTWFTIADQVQAPVSDGRLAVWDTSSLTPGIYQLRLTVAVEDGQSLESVVGKLRVGPQAAPFTPTTAATPTIVPQLPPGQSKPPLGQGQTLAPPRTPADKLFQVLKTGAFSAIAALLLLGLYTLLRPRLRVYLGSIQNRRLDPRRRARRRGRRS